MGNWSGANMRCPKCNKYMPDRCICNGPSIEERRASAPAPADVALPALPHGGLFYMSEVEQIRRQAVEYGKNWADVVHRAVQAGSAERYRKLEDERDKLDEEVADLRAALSRMTTLTDKVSIKQGERQSSAVGMEPVYQAYAARYNFIEQHATLHGGGHGFTITCFVGADEEDMGVGIDKMIAAAPAPEQEPILTPEQIAAGGQHCTYKNRVCFRMCGKHCKSRMEADFVAVHKFATDTDKKP